MSNGMLDGGTSDNAAVVVGDRPESAEKHERIQDPRQDHKMINILKKMSLHTRPPSIARHYVPDPIML